MYPSNFNNAIKAIEEVLVEGKGISPYVIPANTFDISWAYETRTEEGLSHDTLIQPQIRCKVSEIVDHNAWFRPANIIMYKVTFEIEIAYKLDSAILQDVKRQIETTVANAAPLVQKALTNPNTMLTTNDSEPTGIVSGRLKFLTFNNIRYQYTTGVALASFRFEGFIVLTN